MGEDEQKRKLNELRRRLIRLGTDPGLSGSIFAISGIFTGLENLLKIVSEMDKKGQTNVKRAGELKFKDSKIVYGLSIKLGTEGLIVDKFGNIGEDDRGPVVRDEREPLVDVFEEPHQLRVIAELPGVDEESIRVDMKDAEMTIEAHNSTRKYHKKLSLPCRVTLAKSSFKNGVLEVVLAKTA